MTYEQLLTELQAMSPEERQAKVKIMLVESKKIVEPMLFRFIGTCNAPADEQFIAEGQIEDGHPYILVND
jgi:hypothetical protein